MQIEPIGKQGDFFETIRWFPSERKLMEIEKYLSTSDFAEEYIYVSKSALPGRYRNNNNPPLIGIMNISDRKGVFKKTKFKVTVKGVQQGVTLAEQIVTARKAEKSSQSALVAMETQQKVGRTNEHRFQPLLRDSPRLADLISNNPDDTSKFNIVLKNNFNFIFGWSGSRSTLSSDPCEHLQIDEVDQWKSVVNLEDLKDRLSTYDETGTASIFSTPGLDGGPIIQEFNACDAQMDFHVECPDCGEIQIMDFEHFIWPFTEQIAKADDAEKMRIANTIEREKLARYACDGCGVLWDDHKRNKAVRLGTNHFFHGWKMRKEIELPISVGLHFPSWISPFKSLSLIVGRRLRALASSTASADRLRMWHNNEAAEAYTYTVDGDGASEEILYARREDYAPKGATWKIPMPAAFLTLGGDIQNNRIEVNLTAWGAGMEPWNIEHRIFMGDTSILFGEAGSPLNDLYEYIIQKWEHESGHQLKISSIGIDSGYLTKAIYPFIRALRSKGVNIYATKGSSIRGKPLLSVPNNTRKKQKTLYEKYGVKPVTINTEMAKDQLLEWLNRSEQESVFVHFNKTYSLDFFRQLTAEHAVTKFNRKGFPERIWELKRKGARNEALDLLVINFIMAMPHEHILKRLVEELKGSGPVAPVRKSRRTVRSKGI